MTTTSTTVRRSAALVGSALTVAGTIGALAAPAASAAPGPTQLCSVTNPSPFFPGAVTTGTGYVQQAYVPDGHSQAVPGKLDFTYWGNPQVSGVDYKRTVHAHWHNLTTGKSGDAETQINVPGAAGPSNTELNALPTGKGDVVVSMTTTNLGPISVPGTCTGKPIHIN